MAYQAKRHKKFHEDFELVDEDGKVVHSLHVSLDADDMIVKIGRRYTEVTRALADTSGMNEKPRNTEEAVERIEKLGRAVVDLLEAVFGREDTETIVELYDGRYAEMAQEVLPFISQCVIPKLTEMRKDNKKSTLSKYNRKTRRRLFR